MLVDRATVVAAVVAVVDENTFVPVRAATWDHVEQPADSRRLRFLHRRFVRPCHLVPLRLPRPLPFSRHTLFRLGTPPDISNGSPRGFGPGRHEMYCHASPHIHERSVDDASSIRNWTSYSSWLVAFCWRRSTVCRWATISGTISGDHWDYTTMKRVKHWTQVIMSVTRLWDWCCCNAWN